MSHSTIRRKGTDAVKALATMISDENIGRLERRYQDEWLTLRNAITHGPLDIAFVNDADMLDYYAHRVAMLAQCIGWRPGHEADHP